MANLRPWRYRRRTLARRGASRSMGADAASGLAVLLAVSLAIAGVFGGYYFGRSTKHASAAPAAVATTNSATVDPQVAAGAHVFVQFACSQCHGPQGKGGISPDVPTLA